LVSKSFLNEMEIHQKYGVAVQTLRNWRCQRKYLNYYKINRKVLYKDEEVCAFFEKHKVVIDD
jgi:hypothetical protein